jgi:hypothetical protein
MFCVKDAVGAGKADEGIAITRHHFNAALGLLPRAATDAAPESPRHLLLAG